MNDPLRSVADLTVAVGVALHGSGAPVHRIEDAVDRVRQAYGISGATIASPTALWIQTGDATRIARLPPADIDLGRLVAILRYVDRIVERPRDPDQLRAGLKRHLDRRDPWPTGAYEAAFIVTSASTAVLLGGSLVDILLSGAAGGLALIVGHVLEPRWEWRPLRNVLLAFVLGLFGALMVPFGAAPRIIVLAGAIFLLPGLSLTTALAEVAEGHLTTGSARLLGVAIVLAQLAAGASLGWWCVGPLTTLVDPIGVPEQVTMLAPLLAPASYAVLMKARPADVPTIWLLAILGWVVSTCFPGLWGAGAGGLAVGLLASPLGRMTRIPDLVLVLPGIMLLVPGTLGVRGVELLLTQQVDTGSTTGLLALETAAAIAAGVLAGQALGRPLRHPGTRGPLPDGSSTSTTR